MNPTNLVLLHGWGGTKESLQPLSKELQKYGFETFLPEMPGHGSTPEMSSCWNMVDFSNWLKTYLEQNNISNPVLIGHSFGGRIIMDSIINQKLKAEKMVLIDASGIKPKNSIKRLFWNKTSKLAKKITGEENLFAKVTRRITYKFIIRESDYVKLSGNLKKTFENINKEFYNDKVKKINIPSLIIWGKNDKATPVWMGIFLNKKIKNSRLEIIEGTHSLPLKKPEYVAKLINNFLHP